MSLNNNFKPLPTITKNTNDLVTNNMAHIMLFCDINSLG